MEKRAFRMSGFLTVGILTLVAVAATYAIGTSVTSTDSDALTGVGAFTLGALAVILALSASGFIIVNPNEARVIQFFGRYIGSIRRSGFHWTWPFTVKKRISLRVRNFETTRLKVSDADGNPVEIAAVIVWRVTDSAKAVFAV